MPARTFMSVDLPVPLPPTQPVLSREVVRQAAFSKRSLWPKRFPAPESWIMGLELSSHKNSGQGRVVGSQIRQRALTTEGTGEHRGTKTFTARLPWRWDLSRLQGGRCGRRDRCPRVRGGTGCVLARDRSRLRARESTLPRGLWRGGASLLRGPPRWDGGCLHRGGAFGGFPSGRL